MMNWYNEYILKGKINSLFSAICSKHDLERLQQCVFCANDPDKCGCSEKDEDENGMCLKYRKRDN